MNIRFTRSQYAMMGTFLFHFLLLAGMNLTVMNEKQKLEQGIRVIFEIPEEMETEEKQPVEEQEDREQSAENRRNIAVNKNEDRETSEKKFSKRRLEEIDKQVMDELKGLEEEVIESRRAEGKGEVEEFKPEEQETEQKARTDTEKAYAGATNITYNVSNRYAVRDYNPVYLCQHGGKVVVNIKVNRKGKVVSAKVNSEASETLDHCLVEYAEQAAQTFYFNEDENAAFHQEGTVSFHFVPQ